MKPVIFKNELILKKDWYRRIKELMILAGWKNISSNIAIDNDVMWSSGESGKLDMKIRLREYGTNPALGVSNSNERELFYNLVKRYTPGVNGAPGTFVQNVNDSDRLLVTVPMQYPEAYINLYYNCNKNRCLFINDGIPGTTFLDYTEQAGTIIGIGISDRTPLDAIVGDVAPFVMSTQMRYITGVAVAGTPYAINSAVRAVPVYIDTPPKNPNNPDDVFISEISFGDSTTGILGVIDGIYPITNDANKPIWRNDTLIDSKTGVRYRVIQVNPPIGTYWYGSFYRSEFYAIQVEGDL